MPSSFPSSGVAQTQFAGASIDSRGAPRYEVVSPTEILEIRSTGPSSSLVRSYSFNPKKPTVTTWISNSHQGLVKDGEKSFNEIHRSYLDAAHAKLLHARMTISPSLSDYLDKMLWPLECPNKGGLGYKPEC